MGRGNSGISGGKSGGGTPSGIDYKQFMAMSDDQKFQTMADIVADSNIKVPNYLDDSATSKVLYGLGMTNKPTVVSDDALDKMSGREIFRTVYESGSMPPPSSEDVADQIRYGDFTQMSGSGGSAHGRAIYFATDFTDSTTYGRYETNAVVMRGKLNSTAKIRNENSLDRQMRADSTFNSKMLRSGVDGTHHLALYAISQGVDGWYSGTYTMMVNRGAITMSNKTKAITTTNGKGNSVNVNYSNKAYSWAEAGDP